MAHSKPVPVNRAWVRDAVTLASSVSGIACLIAIFGGWLPAHISSSTYGIPSAFFGATVLLLWPMFLSSRHLGAAFAFRGKVSASDGIEAEHRQDADPGIAGRLPPKREPSSP
jgi:hypothetical protein